jgi:hypothetical protein
MKASEVAAAEAKREEKMTRVGVTVLVVAGIVAVRRGSDWTDDGEEHDRH